MAAPHSILISILLALTLAAPALAADPLPVFDGDRMSGNLPQGDSEVGLALDALEGTVLTVKVVATGDATLEPEVRVYDPDDVRIPAGSRYRHATGSDKARIKRLVLPETGCYTIVVTGLGAAGGAFRLRLRATHPVTIRDRGELMGTGGPGHLRFPAFEGTTARLRVKGREGLRPRVETMLEPDVGERDLDGIEIADAVLSVDGIECPTMGDYRLVIEGRDGTRGSWKGKVKLRHPVRGSRELEVDGQPAGTYTADKRESSPSPIPGPGPGPGPLTFRVLEEGWISAITTSERHVCRTPVEYHAMWSRHRPPMPPGIGAPEVAPPPVDFAREIVVGIFLGGRPTGGYVAKVLSLESQGTGALVHWQEQQPGWNPVPQVVTSPYVIVAMTRVDGPVSFSGTTVVQ